MIYHTRPGFMYDTGLADLKETVDLTVIELRKRKTKFDSIVVRGNSGVLVGAPVSLRLNKPLVVVRKGTEKSHASNHIINQQNIGARYIFLDDFISTGNTLKACKRVIHNQGITATHVANFIYHGMSWEEV